MDSMLIFDVYRVQECVIRANDAFEMQADEPTRTVSFNVGVRPDLLQHKDEPGRAQLILDLVVDCVEGHEKSLPYWIQMKTRLYFHCDTGTLSEEQLLTKALRTVVGMIRGQLAHMTASGTNGQFILPELNLSEIAKMHLESQQNDDES